MRCPKCDEVFSVDLSKQKTKFIQNCECDLTDAEIIY